MIRPVNGHVVIEPVAHESFIASHRETYEEIGIVRAIPWPPEFAECEVGDKVFFDSWLAAKFPVEGNTGQFHWLVKWADVRAVESNAKSTLPE